MPLRSPRCYIARRYAKFSSKGGKIPAVSLLRPAFFSVRQICLGSTRYVFTIYLGLLTAHGGGALYFSGLTAESRKLVPIYSTLLYISSFTKKFWMNSPIRSIAAAAPLASIPDVTASPGAPTVVV